MCSVWSQPCDILLMALRKSRPAIEGETMKRQLLNGHGAPRPVPNNHPPTGRARGGDEARRSLPRLLLKEGARAPPITAAKGGACPVHPSPCRRLGCGRGRGRERGATPPLPSFLAPFGQITEAVSSLTSRRPGFRTSNVMMTESSKTYGLPKEALPVMVDEGISTITWNRDEQEQTEWDNLNKLLRQHGLRPVYLENPGTSRNITDVIPMDRQSSQAIRYALKTLLEETERQRKIVRGLIEDNRQLRDELRLERSRASQQEQRANDLEIIVENVKHKIRQLEDESIAHACQQQNQVKELHKDYQASQTKCNQQIDKMEKQEETIAHLQKELHKLNMEEEERIATQKKMFRQFCKQASRTRMDQQMCCLIDYYESQISQMRKELRRYKREIDHTREEEKEDEFLKNMDATPNYKALLMSFQTQIIETKARNEQLLHENTNLKKEMEIRPTVQELKLYKHQIKKLEKTLKNISKEEELKENRELKSNIGDPMQETCRKYLQVLLSIDSVIRSPTRAPLVMYMQKKGLSRSWPKENEHEYAFEHLPLVVEMWADQLMSLKHLHRSLKKLFLRLVPWYMDSVEESKCVRVEELQMMVDEISAGVEDKEKNCSIPSQQMLYAIVSHFQKLFDVHSLNGVYPRMNEVYMKLAEMTNAMRNLRDVLELDNTSPPSVLVNTVGKLCGLFRQNMTWQVEQLLGTQDVQSIIYKLEEHENFFPAFQALIQDLFHVLEVRYLTDIVPAVQQLKQRAE